MSLRYRRAAGAFALIVVSSAVALAAAEALVRAFAPQAVRVAWEDEQEGIRVPRARVQGRHAVPGKFDVRVTINAQRFRGSREYSASPPAGVTRLAVLGDSMTFGWGAADAETYPAQLESVLNARVRGEAAAVPGSPSLVSPSARVASPSPPVASRSTAVGSPFSPPPLSLSGAGGVEVINAGYPGTCLGEKAAWYVQGVRPFHPSLVVLTLLGDDVDGDLFWGVFSLDAAGRAVPNPPSRRSAAANAARSTRSVFQALPGYERLAERSELFALVRAAASRVASRERTSAVGQAPATPREVDRFRGEGLALLAGELRWLRDRTREDGAELAVVLIPFRESVYPSGGWWADELRWKTAAAADAADRTCRELGVPFRDLTPAMVARSRSAAVPLYHEGIETHPTPAGYRAIAEEVAAFLLRD